MAVYLSRWVGVGCSRYVGSASVVFALSVGIGFWGGAFGHGTGTWC